MELKRYIVMNKNTPVLACNYDTENHIFASDVELIASEYAPPGVVSPLHLITPKSINVWWRDRLMPMSRMGEEQDEIWSYLEKHHALSLSDRYWIKEEGDESAWADINYFDNDFEFPLGLALLGGAPLSAPSFTSNGMLDKSWIIENGKRVLLKSGTKPLRQEVYNEVIATRLHERLLAASDYVGYWLHEQDSVAYSACENMLGPDEEYIAFSQIAISRKKPAHKSYFEYILSCYEELGLFGTEAFFSKLFSTDFILANSDRHLGNFGVIRNVETLKYTRIAPIFDTGKSLWCDSLMETPRDYEYAQKPFGVEKGGHDEYGNVRPAATADRFLRYYKDYTWYDSTNIEGFPDDISATLSGRPGMTEERIEKICKGVSGNIERLNRHVEEVSG